jgi:hypothetical protein
MSWVKIIMTQFLSTRINIRIKDRRVHPTWLEHEKKKNRLWVLRVSGEKSAHARETTTSSISSKTCTRCGVFMTADVMSMKWPSGRCKLHLESPLPHIYQQAKAMEWMDYVQCRRIPTNPTAFKRSHDSESTVTAAELDVAQPSLSGGFFPGPFTHISWWIIAYQYCHGHCQLKLSSHIAAGCEPRASVRTWPRKKAATKRRRRDIQVCRRHCGLRIIRPFEGCQIRKNLWTLHIVHLCSIEWHVVRWSWEP